MSAQIKHLSKQMNSPLSFHNKLSVIDVNMAVNCIFTKCLCLNYESGITFFRKNFSN